MDASTITTIFEGLLFGETWYIGILLFLILAIALLKMWKFSGAIIIPLIIIVETEYYERLNADTGNLVWPMIMLGLTALTVAVYTASEVAKKRRD